MCYKKIFPDRSCLESLSKLSLPSQALDHIKKLAGDLRLLCAKEVFKEAVEGKLSLQWIFQSLADELIKE